MKLIYTLLFSLATLLIITSCSSNEKNIGNSAPYGDESTVPVPGGGVEADADTLEKKPIDPEM